MEQQIKFCKTADGVRIAYATVGEGRALVKAANWLNHNVWSLGCVLYEMITGERVCERETGAGRDRG